MIQGPKLEEDEPFSFFIRYGSFKKSCRRGRLEATGGTNVGHAVDGGSR